MVEQGCWQFAREKERKIEWAAERLWKRRKKRKRKRRVARRRNRRKSRARSSFANGQSFEMVNDSRGPSRRAAAVPETRRTRVIAGSESCGRSASN